MKRQTILFIIGLILSLVLVFIPWHLLRYGMGAVLFWILPGSIWAACFSPDDLSRLEKIAIALGLSFVNSLVVVLTLAYLPGPITLLKLVIGL